MSAHGQALHVHGLQIFILEDWAIAFTVLYLAASTETSFNGTACQKSLLGCVLPSSEMWAAGSWVSCIPAPSNSAGVLTYPWTQNQPLYLPQPFQCLVQKTTAAWDSFVALSIWIPGLKSLWKKKWGLHLIREKVNQIWANFEYSVFHILWKFTDVCQQSLKR